MLLSLLLACASPDEPPVAPTPAPRALADLRARLAPPEPRAGPHAELGSALDLGGTTVQPLVLDALPGLPVGGALFLPERPGPAGVIMAAGHFGGGKSTPQVQQLARRLAADGLTVLAVDSTGTEEWGKDALALHMGRGAHHRAWLLAGGSSALALQLAALQAGLDLLEQRGVERVVATGASGGAEQAFWLGIADDRVTGIVLAAPPDLPRHPGTGGCSCGLLPGLPGPDPTVLAALPVPSLWLSERADPPPRGLPDDATWRSLPGPHDYTEAMQQQAVAWIHALLGTQPGPWLAEPPVQELRYAGPPRAYRGITDLQLRPTTRWQPAPQPGLDFQLACSGEGPTVILAAPADATVDARGHRLCRLVLPDTTLARDAAEVRGQVFADRVAGAVAAAADQSSAVEAWGFGGWSVAVAGSGVPCRLFDPPATVDELGADDPVWTQVPGLWWGLAPELWSRCELGSPRSG